MPIVEDNPYGMLRFATDYYAPARLVVEATAACREAALHAWKASVM